MSEFQREKVRYICNLTEISQQLENAYKNITPNSYDVEESHSLVIILVCTLIPASFISACCIFLFAKMRKRQKIFQQEVENQ